VALVEVDGTPQLEEIAELPPHLQKRVDDRLGKAGARHSKETLSALRRLRAELDALIGDGDSAGDEPPKSDEAEATGKASDPDADIHLQLKLLKEQLS
jgi:hypothetical protein